MEQQLSPNLERYQVILQQYGFDLIRALALLVIGLMWIRR